jgi:hypothetical protein
MRCYFRFEERAGIAALWHAFGPHLGSITYTIPGAAFGHCLIFLKGCPASASRRAHGPSSVMLAAYPPWVPLAPLPGNGSPFLAASRRTARCR